MDNYLMHHGIKGQKWGVRNGPPYPLKKYNTKVTSSNKSKINDIYKTMNAKDKNYINPGHGRRDAFYSDKEYDKSGMTLYSNVQTTKGVPTGFITVAKIPENKNVSGTKGAEIAIGVRSGKEYRGKGNASELTKRMVDWFDRQNEVDTLWWLPDKENTGSIRTALKNGFVKDELGDGYVLTKTSREATKLAEDISKKVKIDSKDPVGNQNCMLCTWCAESCFRGKNILPRPVYSPRDKIFQIDESKIVHNANKTKLSKIKSISDYIKGQPYGSRFYCHVNWKGSSGGHEFLVINDVGMAKVLDAQSGTYASIKDPDGAYYFKDINKDNSYIFRIDNQPLNQTYMNLNQSRNILEWDEKKDIDYMKKHNML